MTSSTNGCEQAQRIIAEMTAQLDEACLVRTIDEPIDQAVASFEGKVQRAISHKQFHEVLARFVCHIYKDASCFPRTLSLAQGRDEAVFLLDQGYEGTYGRGYDAACLEARGGGHDGLDTVLGRLAETIKASRRRMHTRAVFNRWIDPSNWPLKCEIASVLLQRYQAWLPPVMQGRPPDDFADDIPTLLDMAMSVDQLLQRIPSESLAFPS